MERDPSLCPRENFVLVQPDSDDGAGVHCSTWDLREMLTDDKTGLPILSNELINTLLDSIALCVIEHLEKMRGNTYGAISGERKTRGKSIQPGELCMLMVRFRKHTPRCDSCSSKVVCTYFRPVGVRSGPAKGLSSRVGAASEDRTAIEQ